MERSLFTLMSNGLLGAAAFGVAALGFIWPVPGDPPPGKNEGNWRLLDPISYENLTVFPVVSSVGYDTREFLTLEEGLSRGDVVVREQGADTMMRDRGGVIRPVAPGYGGPSVNQLVLVNRSKQPLILLAGELVSGGKQDRVIAKDRIVAPGSEPLPLDVFCVEHGRWSQGANFTSAKTIVHPSVREQAAMNKSQSDVWASVTAGSTAPRAAAAPPPVVSQDALSVAVEAEAPTQSYAKLYDSRRVAPSVDAMVSEVERRFKRQTAGLKGERVVGVVVAYGGEVAWSDIFASAELFEQYWGKLLRSYAVEAVARPTLREVAAKDEAQEFLQRLNGREKTESEPGVYRWREINEGKLSQIELDVLEPKVMTLHRLMVRRTS
ncbi:MAG TPA: DUF6569 family protein [Candidatus Saccharimonadales bacterium]|nr:DUF6569 family protein [Candidatus Saccharimonadales bacterium]